MLARHSVNEALTWRLQWAEGMLAIWDNRTTQHFAVNDYQGHRREMVRTCGEGCGTKAREGLKCRLRALPDCTYTARTDEPFHPHAPSTHIARAFAPMAQARHLHGGWACGGWGGRGAGARRGRRAACFSSAFAALSAGRFRGDAGGLCPHRLACPALFPQHARAPAFPRPSPRANLRPRRNAADSSVYGSPWARCC